MNLPYFGNLNLVGNHLSLFGIRQCRNNDLGHQPRNRLWDHSFRTSANFHDFWPLPPYNQHSSKMLMKGIFALYILWPLDLWTIGTWGHPSHLSWVRLRGPVIQANGRLTFEDDLRSGGLLCFISMNASVRTEFADSMVLPGEPRDD